MVVRAWKSDLLKRYHEELQRYASTGVVDHDPRSDAKWAAARKIKAEVEGILRAE